MRTNLLFFTLFFLVLDIIIQEPFEGFLVYLFEKRADSFIGFSDILEDGVEFVEGDNVSDDRACSVVFGDCVGDDAECDIADDDIDFPQDTCDADFAYESSQVQSGDCACNPIGECEVDVKYQDVGRYGLINDFVNHFDTDFCFDEWFINHIKNIEVMR